ncbi:MAG: nuclear transport factor 2 family protein [Halieaceae bacterium]|nr:nuclear transport factor 2 family protein [Halieaceae bacterium]
MNNLNMVTKVLLSLMMLSWASGQPLANPTPENDRIINTINSINKKLANCTNKGDVECAAMYYTKDAVYIGPNMKPLVGRDAIKSGMVDDGSTLLTLQADEVELLGNTANELGTYTTATRDGKLLDVGSYIVVWKKTDDGWKLHWDIFNSNLPKNQ